MTKPKQLSKVMSRKQRRASCGLGDYSASEAVQHSTQEVLGKSGFYKTLEGAMQKQSMIGKEVEFFRGLAGPIF